VPAGAAVPGWSGSGPRWKFLDRDGGLASGITKVLVTDRSRRTPGLFQFRVRGKEADFQLDTTNLELIVILGGNVQGAGGQCARLEPTCVTVGTSMKCD
jgi:hypothetical protein